MRQGTAFHGAHQHTHIRIHRLPNQALKTTRLSATILEEFPEEPTRAIRGFGVCVECAVKIGVPRVHLWLFPEVGMSFDGRFEYQGRRVGEVWSGRPVFVSLQLGMGRIAVW